MAVKKRVLISGGAGFLGSHLADYYLEQGCMVVAVDDFSTGQKKNLSHLIADPNFSFVEADITKELPKKITANSYNIVLNLASPASPPHYQRLAVHTLLVGSIGTKNMLDLALRDGARFFHASTSEVYGDPEMHPQPEHYKGSVNCYGPRAMYDEAKRYAEAMIYVYRKQLKVDTCIARFFNTFGPRMDANDGRVVSNFIVQALRGDNITIYGKGEQTRSFCYVDDLIKGIALLVESNHHDPVNIGNPSEFTVKELAEKVIKMTKSSSKLTYHPLPKDDPMQRKPVIELANLKLGWKPEVPLEHGLLKTIEYFKTVI